MKEKLADGWRNTQGRPKGKTTKVKVRNEFNHALDNIVAGSQAGDINASIALVQYHMNQQDSG